MKIAFLAPHLKVSGGILVILRYASLLQKMGHDVTVIVESPRKLRRTVANILQIGKPTWVPNFSARVLRVGSFEELDFDSHDAVFATSVPTALFLDTCLSISPKKKFFLIQHDEGLYHSSREEANQAYATDMHKIAVSHWIQEIVQPYSSSKVEVLLNTVDTKLFNKIDGQQSDDVVNILMLHHTYPWKGTDEGIEMVRALKSKGVNVHLTLFGARTKNVTVTCDEYLYNVKQSDLLKLYSKADIFLCPSWDEGFGLPSLEAMACGAALVTYDNGGSRDFAHPNQTAFVAEHRNKEALLQKLEQAVSDKALRERIIKQGATLVSRMPSWSDQAQALENIIIKETRI